MTPGIGEIVGADSPRDWEDRKGPGMSGATVVFRGLKLSRFAIKFRLYDAVDWADWTAFQVVVRRVPDKRDPRALDIVHPLLEPLGIRAIVVENIAAPQQSDDGVWEIELKVIEFRRPTPALATVGTPPKPDGSKDKPIDPVEAEIERLRQKAAAKHKQLART
jgi:hypothetical protein